MKYLLAFFLFATTFAKSEQKPRLSDFKNNIYSQWGEDGIIKKIFEEIGVTSKIAIEFGASDGFCASNTANLWAHDPTWKGVLIESGRHLFNQLVTNVSQFNCVAINQAVGISSKDSLEAILKNIGISDQIDLLSIDIDGNDYYIFQSLENLKPRLIIIEYNPSIPAHLDVYSEYNNHLGCSVAALQRIAAEKGYSLIAITETNCFFVLNQDYPKFAGYDTDREHIRIDKFVSYVISDYESGYQVIGNPNFVDPWGWNEKLSKYPTLGEAKPLPSKITRPK